MATGDGSPSVTRRSKETLDATERRRAEEALRESETILQRLLESASEAVVIVDGDGRIVLFSARAEEMFGYSRDELIGQTVETLIPGQFRDAHVRHRADYVAHPHVRPMSSSLDLVGRRKDGTEFPIEIGLSAIETDGAGLTMSLIADISERKQAEAALRESEANLADIAGSLKEVVWSASPNTVETLYLNAAAEAVYGRPVAEFLANTHLWFEVIHPEDKERVTKHVQDSMKDGSTELEYRIIRPDGGVCWLHGQARLVRDASGHVTRIVGITADISERKRAEEALRESEELFRSTFEHAPIGMVLADADGRFLQVNQSMCEMLGYSEEELTSTTWQAITHPDDLDSGLDQMRRTLAGEMDSCQFDKRYFHKLGHVVWVQLSFSLVRGDDGRPLYFISQIQDITERKRAVEQLQVAREELEGRVERQLMRRNPYGLTFRELTALNLVAAGKSDKEIGIDLGISPLTARKHLSNILAKMDASSRTEAVARSLREGLLD